MACGINHICLIVNGENRWRDWDWRWLTSVQFNVDQFRVTHGSLLDLFLSACPSRVCDLSWWLFGMMVLRIINYFLNANWNFAEMMMIVNSTIMSHWLGEKTQIGKADNHVTQKKKEKCNGQTFCLGQIANATFQLLVLKVLTHGPPDKKKMKRKRAYEGKGNLPSFSKT